MSDWVHCNKCYVQPNDQASFYLTECGHIFCQRCAENIKSSNICSICNKSGHVVLLNKNVEHNVLDFFEPLESHLKKANEVYEFQAKNRNALLQNRNALLQNMVGKYNFAKKAYIDAQNTIKKLTKENQMLRAMLISVKGSANSRSQSTPLYAPSAAMDSSDVTFQNASPVSTIHPRVVPRVSTLSTPSDRNMSRFPGYPRRNNMLGSGSSGTTLHRPSPAQKVPLGFDKFRALPPVHRGVPSAMEVIRRGTCHQK